MKSNNPKEIYSEVISDIKNIINEFESGEYDQLDENDQKFISDTLNKTNSELYSELESVSRNSEWEIFNIAFYGETNAGKSTLIETLRILLQEAEKVEQRKEFDIKKVELKETKDKIDNEKELQKQINDEYNIKTNHLIEKTYVLKESISDHKKEIEELEKQKSDIENLIYEKKKNSLFYLLAYKLGLYKEKENLLDINNNIQKSNFSVNDVYEQLQKLEDEINLMNGEKNNKLEEFNSNIVGYEKNYVRLIEELDNLSDGKIIDAHADFTKKTTEYNFSKDNQRFALLDLPGIEGKKEKEVQDEIKKGVEKAHAVFYITKKAAPPQNADDENILVSLLQNDSNESTSTKINKDLGQHREIYSIYNKTAKNPSNIENGLINKDEKVGLLELEKAMVDNIGESYVKNIVISAYPAFLSVCKTSNSKYLNSKEKFLKKYSSAEELLSISEVDKFVKFIEEDLLLDCKSKIKKSNYHKIIQRLDSALDDIGCVKKQFISFKEKLYENNKNTEKQLNESVTKLESELNNSIKMNIRLFKTDFRQKMYDEIDKNIDDKDLEREYKLISEKSQKELQKNLDKSINATTNSYNDDISSILKKHYRKENELLDVYSNNMNFDFNFTSKLKKIENFDLKKTTLEIGGAIVSAIISIVTGIGIPIAIIAVIVTIGKNIWCFFDSDKKMADQKERINKGIDETSTKIEESIKPIIDKNINKIQDNANKIKKDINISAKNIEKMIITIEYLENKIRLKISDIKREENL